MFERLEWTLADWDAARGKLADIETRMTRVLDELGLTALVTSIDGLSAVGAAAILARTGDLRRFTSGRPRPRPRPPSRARSQPLTLYTSR